jgi:hypothetical protein
VSATSCILIPPMASTLSKIQKNEATLYLCRILQANQDVLHPVAETAHHPQPPMQECVSLAETYCTVECFTWGLMSDAANQANSAPLPVPRALKNDHFFASPLPLH